MQSKKRTSQICVYVWKQESVLIQDLELKETKARSRSRKVLNTESGWFGSKYPNSQVSVQSDFTQTL